MPCSTTESIWTLLDEENNPWIFWTQLNGEKKYRVWSIKASNFLLTFPFQPFKCTLCYSICSLCKQEPMGVYTFNSKGMIEHGRGEEYDVSQVCCLLWGQEFETQNSVCILRIHLLFNKSICTSFYSNWLVKGCHLMLSEWIICASPLVLL